MVVMEKFFQYGGVLRSQPIPMIPCTILLYMVRRVISLSWDVGKINLISLTG